MLNIQNEVNTPTSESTNPFSLFEGLSDTELKQMFSNDTPEDFDQEYDAFPPQT